MVVAVSGGTFEGPRLKGAIIGPAGDWIVQRDDGSRLLDVRAMLQTDDDQRVLHDVARDRLHASGRNAPRPYPADVRDWRGEVCLVEQRRRCRRLSSNSREILYRVYETL